MSSAAGGGGQAAGSSGHHAASSSTSSSRTQDAAAFSAADQSVSSVQFRNGITSPGSPGSDADSTINTSFAPSILASRLGRSIYSSAGAAGSSLSLSGSGFNSPSLALTGFNAVSTVLNNPSKRQHPIDPKSSRFPAVTPNHVPADIPKVKKAELEPYLSSVRPEWDRFMRNQSMGRQGKATIEQQQQQQQRRSSTQDSSFDSEPLGKSSRRHRPTSSMASLSADLQSVPPPQARKRLPNLSAVPQVFFSEDFDLGNPYTFDQVTERHKVTASSPAEQNGSNAPTYDVALNQMLQEKLSYYSDVIEQHLIIEIGQQSSSFFAALGNLNDLNAEAESCLRKIDALKSELELIHDNQAKKGLCVIREQQHRRKLEHKQLAVQDVRQVIERRDLVRLLLQQGETEEALDLLNKLRSTLRRPDQVDNQSLQEKKKLNGTNESIPVALSDLQCLASIPEQLEEMERTLSGMLEQDLVTILKQDIEARLASYRLNGASSTSADKNADYFVGATTNANSLQPILSATDSLLTPSRPPPSPFGHSARELSSADSELAARISPLVVGLAKTGGIEKAVVAYREAAIQAVQNTWKVSLSDRSAEMAETVRWLLSEDLSKFDDHDHLPPPAAHIRDLEHAAFLDVGRELFEVLMECLKAIDAQCKLVPRILDQLSLSGEPNLDGTNSGSGNDPVTSIDGAERVDGTPTGLPLPPTMPHGVPTNLPARLSDVVVASAEEAHTLCARLLTLRASTHATLELPPFLVVFQLCWSFVLSSEQLCRKMIVGLRGTVLSQAKGFLANFHRRRIERAAKAVEEETWAQAEVGAEIQAQIRQIVSSAVEDPADFVVTGSDPQSAQPDTKTADSADDASPALAKTLDIEDRQYFVVDASLDVLSLLVDYLKVIINLPLLTTEAMARVVEFLKQFNSRTCQVVLGAGAMRSAGLKNITAKHLALASQSLSIMISLIPYIRETVRRHLSPKQAVMLTEFDKLRRDFQEHQYEIHAKLVAIMSDRLTVHCRTLSAIDWNTDKPTADDKEGEVKDAEPNKYAADLVKETATLHKVLSKYLQAVVVEHVIGQVLRSIDARLAQEFEKVLVQNQHALDRMQTDVRYLGVKLSALKHVEWKDESLQQVLESKRAAATPSVHITSTGTSTPNAEGGPGSPAVDKPAASPFGPVTYKPRIPNIFARRQQQQQQQSQSNSPRASTDVPTLATPVEAQRSVDTTPRTSLQQPSAPLSQALAPEGEKVEERQIEAADADLLAKSDASGAKSLEEEVNEVPPTPPSKTQEVESAAVVQEKEADGRVSEDIVAPVVPAPDIVAKVLSEGPQESPQSAAQPAAEDPDLPAPSEQKAVADASRDVSTEQPDVARASAAEPPNPVTQAAEAANAESTNDAPPAEQVTAPHAEEPTPTGSSTVDLTQSAQTSTPTKKVTQSNGQPSAFSTPAESSPVRSGASTPATVTPSSTPARAGRMSLKERLAEAARKRAQQAAPVAKPTQAEAPVAPAAAATPAADSAAPSRSAAPSGISAEEPKIDAAASGQSAPDADEEKNSSMAAVATEDKVTKAEQEPVDASSEKTGGLDGTKEATVNHNVTPTDEEEVAVDKSEASEVVPAASTGVVSETSTVVPTSAPHVGAGADRVEAEASKPVPKPAPAVDNSANSEPESKESAAVADGAEASKVEETFEAEPQIINGTDANTKTPVATPDAEADADGEGGGDEAEGDADANEGTNDSAAGSAPGSGGKKNKKKKKKGKKK